jgi:hypothetical protein
MFTDLDPALAASFSYDPIAAKKYEDDQVAAALQARQDEEAKQAQHLAE